jgi:signal peptidase I
VGAEAHGPPPVAPRRRWWWAVAALVALAVVVTRVFFVEPFRTDGVSMVPTLRSGDRVLVDKRAYRQGLPRRGDLVVFHAPRTGDVTLKRAIGLPGDTVAIEDGRLVVNGRRPVEPYTDPDAIDSVYFGPVRVRSGTVFFLGDNRLDSRDSRDFGAVTQRELIGRVSGLVWPPSRW